MTTNGIVFDTTRDLIYGSIPSTAPAYAVDVALDVRYGMIYPVIIELGEAVIRFTGIGKERGTRHYVFTTSFWIDPLRRSDTTEGEE